ncbi:MAG: alpha/beta fold hydrolase [Rhodospirillaceae bacterium]|nr:alpha/beta fold hydrolase [Rhodospirillaceae bacterium]
MSGYALNKIATAAGLALAWREAGAGAAIVFLHGIGSGSEGWEAQLAHFGSTHRAIAWDAPGYGGSGDLDPLAPAAADYADALAGLLDALGIGRAALVGNSLGALMAAAFVRRYPARVDALVLSDVAAGHARLDAEERDAKLMQRLDDVAELGPAGMAEKRAGNLISPKAGPGIRNAVVRTMSKVRPKGYGQAARMLSLGDVFLELRGCTARTLVVCGADDKVTPPEGNRRVAAAIPGARFELLEGVGHLPYLEAPARFNALVGDFLAQAKVTA